MSNEIERDALVEPSAERVEAAALRMAHIEGNPWCSLSVMSRDVYREKARAVLAAAQSAKPSSGLLAQMTSGVITQPAPKPLTDLEALSLMRQLFGGPYAALPPGWLPIIRATERHHGIKENQQ